MKKLIAFAAAVMMLVCVSSFAVSATAYPLGDVNKSGDVEVNDLVSLRKSLLGLEAESTMANVNEDEAVDIRDLVHLKKMIANPSTGVNVAGGNGQSTVITEDWN